MKKQVTGAWVWRVSRPDAWRIALLAAISGLISLSYVVFAVLSQRVIDMATGTLQGNLWLPGAGLLGMLVLQCGLNILYSHLQVWVTGRVEMRLKDRVFAALFSKRWQDVSAYHSGDLLNRLTSDSQVVVTGVVTIVPRLVSLVTRLIACVVVMLTIDWRFTLVMLALGLLMLVASRFYGKRMKSLHKDCQSTDGEARSFMQEGLENWMVIRSFDGEGVTRLRLGERMRRHFAAKLRRSHWSNLSHTALYLLFSGSYYIALLWGALRLAAGALTYGSLTAFLQIVSQIRTPFMNMSGVLPQYYNMLASAERLMELEEMPDEPRTALPMPVTALYDSLTAIRVEDVHFAYEAENPVLTGADLTLKKGEFVALAGFSGIGKSTLFKLLLAFLTPDAGRLWLEGEGVEQPVDASTRPLFAYVPQQNMLLSGTIRENIAFCNTEADEAAIWEAARVAEVAEVIRQLPDGLDTVLGERGTGLSEGQIQRLAIARAVLGGAPVLLLDEATSSLDEPTEERVLRNLRALSGRTCLCISHRPAALSVCDRVIRIADGHFTEG